MRYLFYISVVLCVLHPIRSQSDFDSGLKAMSEKNWKQAITLFQDDSDSSYSVEADYNIGLCYVGLKDFNTALYFFERALKSSPSSEIIIHNASLSFAQLYPEESWGHPYNGFTRMILSLSTNAWMILSLCITLLVAMLFYLILVKKDRNKFAIILLFIIPIWFFTFYSVYETYYHATELDYCIPKNGEIASYLTKDGMESGEELLVGKRYEIISQPINEWVRLKSESNKTVWVEIADVNVY